MKQADRKHILIISRHYPAYGQIKKIQQEYGEDCLITLDNQRFEGLEDVLGRYYAGSYDNLAIVAPKEIIAGLYLLGVCPLVLSTIVVPEGGEKKAGDFQKNDGPLLRPIVQKIININYDINYQTIEDIETGVEEDEPIEEKNED